MLNLKIFALMLILASPAIAVAGPALSVGAMSEFIPGGKNIYAKRIYNTGDATAFVKITIDEITFTDSSGSVEKPLDTEALINGKGIGLISSPPRLIIPAGGVQTNRLLFTGTRDTERYYRVRYIPVEQKDFHDTDKQDHSSSENAVNTGVNVLTGFGTVVTVGPGKTVFNTKTEGRGNQIAIHNNGNASIFISQLKSCKPPQKECSAVESIQLRPGKQLTRTAPAGWVWHYTLSEGTQKKNFNTL